ncbi:MAG: GNAT family N-acetyltransferase [Nitrosotalea sp.]
MPSAGNRDLISRVEAVDLAFTGLWSNSINLKCGTLFFNQNLPNDVFFDKLTNMTCLDGKTLDDSLYLFQKYHTTPYVYTLNQPKFEEKLLEQNFKLYDTQYVLTKTPDSVMSSKARRISRAESMVWSETFCSAYNCCEWITSVDEIVKRSCDSIEYYVDESASSCVALYESNSMFGLYCLGTVPAMRKKGIAESLIDFAIDQVKRRNLEFLMLETYQRDKLLDFYFKLGFKEIYQKNIYTI